MQQIPSRSKQSHAQASPKWVTREWLHWMPWTPLGTFLGTFVLTFLRLPGCQAARETIRGQPVTRLAQAGLGWPALATLAGLGWAGLGLGWAGLVWTRLGCLAWFGLGWAWLGWVDGLGWAGLGWTGLVAWMAATGLIWWHGNTAI